MLKDKFLSGKIPVVNPREAEIAKRDKERREIFKINEDQNLVETVLSPEMELFLLWQKHTSLQKLEQLEA